MVAILSYWWEVAWLRALRVTRARLLQQVGIPRFHREYAHLGPFGRWRLRRRHRRKGWVR